MNKLKKNSRIYLTVPAHNFPWSDVDTCGVHLKRCNEKIVSKLTSKLDAQIEYFTNFLKYLSRISYLLRALPYKLEKRIPNETIYQSRKKQYNSKSIKKPIFDFLEKNELKKYKFKN